MVNAFKGQAGATQLLATLAHGKTWGDKILVAFPPEAGLGPVFGSGATYWHHDYAIFHQDPRQGSFSLPAPAGPFDAAFFYIPKSKDYQQFGLKLLLPELAAQAPVLAVGPKDGGAGSARPLLEAAGLEVLEKHHGRHCVLWECRSGAPAPKTGLAFSSFQVGAWGQTVEARSLPGVFSHGRLDTGSAFFLETLSGQPLSFQAALDWGCGAGALGALLKKTHPGASVLLTDISAPALASASETLRCNRLEAEVLASDGFSHLQGSRFDLIVSNPPAHKGFDSDFGATQDFLAKAPGFMAPNACLYLVANIQLPYAKMLGAKFQKVERIAANRQFQVLLAQLGAP